MSLYVGGTDPDAGPHEHFVSVVDQPLECVSRPWPQAPVYRQQRVVNVEEYLESQTMPFGEVFRSHYTITDKSDAVPSPIAVHVTIAVDRSVIGEEGTGKGFGGDRGARTPNLGIANAALSQLSYIPTSCRRLNYTICMYPINKFNASPSRACSKLTPRTPPHGWSSFGCKCPDIFARETGP